MLATHRGVVDGIIVAALLVFAVATMTGARAQIGPLSFHRGVLAIHHLHGNHLLATGGLLQKAKYNLTQLKVIESVEQRFKMGSEHVYGDFTSLLETAVELVIKTIQDPSAAKESITNVLFEHEISKLRDAVAQLGRENAPGGRLAGVRGAPDSRHVTPLPGRRSFGRYFRR
ncbi:hypothetical protein [Bradyrhizobium sp. AS23.2]|uniref:hypothetical protein n=1 Tax=Bradyrhizobium sp. AS23.2 TaxID=1680155 RepID=UPI0014302173|nr:hypothetical protein [Bradyrhizobium sp. AS23.2]